jgi:hypothetical protein
MPTTRLEVPGTMPTDAAKQDPTLTTRPRFFPIQTLIRYRPRGATGWNETTTVNISRSSVLFETAQELPVDILLEMQILFPTLSSKVICCGPVIRTGPSQATAAIHRYYFRRLTRDKRTRMNADTRRLRHPFPGVESYRAAHGCNLEGPGR